MLESKDGAPPGLCGRRTPQPHPGPLCAGCLAQGQGLGGGRGGAGGAVYSLPCIFSWDTYGNGNPLQYSCLETPLDRGARRATVDGVTQSGTRLSTQAQKGEAWSVLLVVKPPRGLQGATLIERLCLKMRNV